MNKPLKNSEWKSNCASSYYWITSLWKPEADLSSDSTLNLHAAVGARPFPWADTVFYLSVSFVVITFHHRHMWAILQPWTQKTWLGHVSSPLTLQGRWHPLEDMQDTDKPRGEGQGKASKPSEGKRSREVFEVWSLSLSLPFLWNWEHYFMLSVPCHSWCYAPTGTECLLCQESTEQPCQEHIWA